MNKLLILKCLCLVLTVVLCTSTLYANSETINVDNITQGYFIIDYSTLTPKKMKVGLKYNNQIINYYDYIPNQSFTYPLENGDGQYEIILYENKKETSYKIIQKTTIDVVLDNPLSPFLISVYNIKFTDKDIVSFTANEICKNKVSDIGKVIAIAQYISANIAYDFDFAEQVNNKTIPLHIPNPEETLISQKGICYDTASLFAAMCRSQNIPCKIKKGYYNNIYHAWNQVYLNGKWYDIDTNLSIPNIIKSLIK